MALILSNTPQARYHLAVFTRALLILCLSFASARGYTVFTNPVVNFGGDPWIVQTNGVYYYMQTTGSDLRIRQAASFEALNRAPETVVYTPSPLKNVWAPELHFISGKWFIYYAADDGDNANHRLYAAESVRADPIGGYLGRGLVIRSDPDRWSIDGTVLQADDGLYLVWSGWENETAGPQNLYIAPMSSPTRVSAPRTLLASPELPWEGTILEGPEVLRNGTNLFIVYSANASWTDNYCLGLLQYTGGALASRSSWQKLAAPVFETYVTPFESVYAPGHCSFTFSPDGSEPWILYHAARRKGSGWDRSVRAQRFAWDDAGLPFFGVPAGINVPVLTPAGSIPAALQVPTNGWALLEVWTSGADSLGAVKAAVSTRKADLFRFIPSLELPHGMGRNFGARMRAFLHPPSAGSYRFYLDASGAAEVSVNGASLLFSEDGVSNPVSLAPDHPPLFEVIAVSPDSRLAVRWSLETDPPPAPSSPGINTTNLAFGTELLPPPEPLEILAQPQNAVISANGGLARFAVQVRGASPWSFQWQHGGASLPGATNAILEITAAEPGPGEYQVRIQNEYQTVNSVPAKIWTFGIAPPGTIAVTGPPGAARLDRSEAVASATWVPVSTQTISGQAVFTGNLLFTNALGIFRAAVLP